MKAILNLSIIGIFLILASCEKTFSPDTSLKLWYTQPATDWQSEALPIGNGYMGAMFFGGIEKEQIQFTEGTLWSGGPGVGEEYNYGIKKGAWKYLSEVRRLLDEGKMEEAHELANKELSGIVKRQGYNNKFGVYGAQQTMGDLFIEVKHEGEVSDYIRELDIENAEGLVQYTVGGAQYTRTYFASYPDQAMVYRFESAEIADYSIEFKTPHQKNRVSFSNSVYSFEGQVSDNGMQFETCLKIETDGKVEFVENELLVSGAKEITIYHVAASNYTTKYPEYKGNDYRAANIKALQNIAEKSFDELRKAHRNDYQNLYKRVQLDLGDNKRDSLLND